MQRIDLRVRGFAEIKDIVALEGLVDKGQTQSQDGQSDDDELTAQEIKIAGLAMAGAAAGLKPRRAPEAAIG
jgi:hypothetical protein